MDPAEQSPCGSPPPSQALSTILAQSTADTAHVTPATTQSQSGHLIEQNVQLDADVPLPNRVSSMNASQSSANIADAMTATSHVQSDPLTPQTNQVTGFNDQSSSHVLPPTQSLSTSLPQPLLGMTDPTPTKDQDQRQSLNQQKNKVTSFNEHMRSSSAPLTQTSSVNLLQSGFKAVDVVRATSHDQTNHLIQQKAMASSSQDSPIVPPPTSRTPSVIDTIETHPATDNQAGGDGVSRAPARQSNKRTASGKRKAAGAPISSHSSDPDLPSPSHKRPATADVHGRTAGQVNLILRAHSSLAPHKRRFQLHFLLCFTTAHTYHPEAAHASLLLSNLSGLLTTNPSLSPARRRTPSQAPLRHGKTTKRLAKRIPNRLQTRLRPRRRPPQLHEPQHPPPPHPAPPPRTSHPPRRRNNKLHKLPPPKLAVHPGLRPHLHHRRPRTQLPVHRRLRGQHAPRTGAACPCLRL